jgi:hypothetical protein
MAELVVNALLIVFLLSFGWAAGFLVGSSNYRGVGSAIAPGIVAGLLVSIPTLSDQLWLASLALTAASVVGSIIVTLLPHTNRLKRFCREQDNLVFRIGPYKLGRNKGA